MKQYSKFFLHSGFIWICSISTAAILWLLIPPLQEYVIVSLIEGVLCQEIGRYAYYQLCAAAERRVAVTAELLLMRNAFVCIHAF